MSNKDIEIDLRNSVKKDETKKYLRMIEIMLKKNKDLKVSLNDLDDLMIRFYKNRNWKEAHAKYINIKEEFDNEDVSMYSPKENIIIIDVAKTVPRNIAQPFHEYIQKQYGINDQSARVTNSSRYNVKMAQGSLNIEPDEWIEETQKIRYTLEEYKEKLRNKKEDLEEELEQEDGETIASTKRMEDLSERIEEIENNLEEL